MSKINWLIMAVLVILAVFITLVLFKNPDPLPKDPWKLINKKRMHLNHAGFFNVPFKTAHDVTKACLECHEQAAKEIMGTVHWTWSKGPVVIPGHNQPQLVGKRNLINNFCIGIDGNWRTCTSCHAGYGWKDDGFDFADVRNVDCLICHDWSGTYAKADYGYPAKDVDLLAVARNVGYPRRENCGICHIYGGGGMGVKHGDLDVTLINASEKADVHMGRHNLLCIDCHRTTRHLIRGVAYSVSVNHENGIACTDCHDEQPHGDQQLNTHTRSIACQTCHIPNFARKAATKTYWDWSKAGDASRPESAHEYLKIKGEFRFGTNLIPEYHWFNLTAKRYLIGDKMNPDRITELNQPVGSISDFQAKIWPFKIHLAKQPYDKINLYLLIPVNSGAGGFWHEFNWEKAFTLAEKESKLAYSGQYGFAETKMYWPLSHMVTPTSQALNCQSCHNENSVFKWQDLGYDRDPEKTGGRFTRAAALKSAGRK
jgi:octaheme c-type cytochrome (tetrathionate reductase family)